MHFLNKKVFHHYPLLIFFIFSSLSLSAQIEVEPTGVLFTPESLITSVFLDSGVEVLEVTHEGTDNSVGYFTNGQSDIGIGRGIIMSTGLVTTAASENDAGGTSGQTSGTNVNDPFLSTISADIQDITKYTIRFIPTSDTLRFRYTFASEEYPEFTCSNFNDIFGFFIYGPGISGPFPNNAANIALVPALNDPTGLTFTDLPVTINNVNPGQVGGNGMLENCTPPDGSLDFGSYYRDNAGSENLTFDGYLKTFFAQMVVTPCEEYTIVLSLADGFDNNFDSAVFLEARSFGTGALQVELNTFSLDGSLSEGCTDGAITFELPTVAEADIPLDYTIFGTATPGVDYSTIPSDLFIPAGESIISIPIVVFEDGIAEPIETIGIDIQRDFCNRDTFYFLLNDNQLTELDLGPDTLICLSAPVQLDGAIPVVIPDPPAFTNSTDYPIITISDNAPPAPGTEPTISPINVIGVQPVTIEENVIKSICVNIDHGFASDVDLFLFSPNGQFLELSTDNGKSGNDYIDACFTPNAVDTIDFGSQAPVTAPPFTGDWFPEGEFEDLYGGPTNGEWYIAVKDDQNGFTGTLLDWTICFNPVYQVNYQWSPSDGLSCTDCPDPIATPTSTTTYTLVVSDTYGCSIEDQITIEVSQSIEAPIVNCVATSNSITLDWAAVAGADDYEINIDNTGWMPVNGNLMHLISGLSINQMVDIQIRGIGNCEGLIQSFTCNSLDCIPPDLSITSVIPADCNGAATGSITGSANGLTPPFFFEITGIGNNTTGIFTDLPAGDYNLILFNNVGCSDSEMFTITEPNSIVTSIVVSEEIDCNGNNSGAVAAVASGGNGPYTFLWDNASIDSVNTSLLAGPVSVTISDQNGCSEVADFVLTEPTIMTLTSANTLVSCFNGNDGTATALPDGGTPPYSFLWDNGQTTQTATGLSQGTTTVDVTDALGCIINTSVDISQNDEISLSFTTIAPTCFNGQNGNLTVMPTGGAGGYSYAWDTGQTSQTAAALGMGTYEVTVTDQNNCTQIGSFTVPNTPAININQTTSPVTCALNSDGEIDLVITGGTGPYSFIWSDDTSISTEDRTNLSGGTYTVTVIDQPGCQNQLSIIVNSPPAISLTTASSPVGCAGGNTGSVEVTPMGGNGPYQYAWNINGVIITQPVVNSLTAGSYVVTVTDTKETVEVLQSAGIDVTETITNIDCFGNNNGQISLAISGGNSPYDLEWTDFSGTVLGNDPLLENQIAGTYQINITDANGCLQTEQFEIIQNSELTLTLGTINNLACNNIPTGSIELLVIGGDGNYTFDWSNGDDQQNLTNLPSGPYSVTVTDGLNCTQEISTTVTEPSVLEILDATIQPASCFSSPDGSILLTVTGGTIGADYQFNWSNGGNSAQQIALVAGDYQVTITDDQGCEIEANYTISSPEEIMLSVLEEPATCSGTPSGFATVTATGGDGNYSYQWDIDAGSQTTATADNLVANIYFVTVTDGNGCSQIATAEVLEPLAISNNFEQVDVDCFSNATGTLSADVFGGSAPYTFSWTGPNGFTASTSNLEELVAGTYNLTITDSNGCVFEESALISEPTTGLTATITPVDRVCFGQSNGTATVFPTGGTGTISFLWNFQDQTTASVNNLPPGSWDVVVTDQSGCSITQTTEIEEDPEIVIRLSETGPLCFNGTEGQAEIMAIEINGSQVNLDDYEFIWSNNETTSQIGNLIGGDRYFVSVTNAIGCQASEVIEISNPDPIQILVEEINSTDCANGNNGSATISGAGGIQPYMYQWSSNAGNQTTATAENLTSGVYTVIISDGNQCTSEREITIAEPESLSIEFSVSQISCPGSADGVISTNITGGTAPYQYAWSTGSTDTEINQIEAGDYELTITDNKGCTAVSNQLIDVPEVLSATTQLIEPTCFGDRDGRITIFATGGVPPYLYSLNQEEFNGTSVQIGIRAGEYDLRVKDSKGCEFSTSVTINEPLPVIVNARTDLEITLGDTLQLFSEIENSVGDVDLFWEAPYEGTLICIPDSIFNCENPFTITQNTIRYNLTAEDSRGCIGETTVQIIVTKPRQVFVPTAFTPNGDGNNDLLLVHGAPGTEVVSYKVFDRWGSLLFENGEFMINDLAAGWNGSYRNERLSSGVYIWQVTVRYLDGELKTLSGNTTLLR